MATYAQRQPDRASERTAESSSGSALHPALNARSAVTQAQAVAAQLNARSEPVQRKPSRSDGLPDPLRASMEAMSGFALDDVRVHRNSDKPAQMQAHAYAQGTDIHLAPGQEKHLPHEAWHVVQQKQGRVRATTQAPSGALVNDDPALEEDATRMGNLAQGIGTTKVLPRSGYAPTPGLTQRMPQGHAATVQLGAAESKVDEEAVVANEYQASLKEVVEKLKGKIGFEASPQGHFDKRYWKVIDDKNYKLAIESTKPASVAIEAMMNADKGVWSFDCAEFVQVCNLYATMQVYDTEEIDKKPLVLKQHGSSPFADAGVTFERTSKDAKFDLIVHRANNATKDQLVDEVTLLKVIPPGTRVCFKNPAAPDTAFCNENALALGGGKFAAHPMGSNLTAQDIIDRLVDHNQKTKHGDANGSRDAIFISQVEIYASIPMPDATKDALGLTPYNKLL